MNRPASLSLILLPVLLALTGCSIATTEFSGPPPFQKSTVPISIHGTAFGGRQPIAYAAIKIFSAGTSGYGAGAVEGTTYLTGTSQYYPGGSTGCLTAALSPATYTVLSGDATFQVSNSLKVGQFVTFNDSSPLSGTTAVVTAASSTTFDVATTSADTTTPVVDSGSNTPVCYTTPTTDQNGNFSLAGDYTCTSSTPLYLTSSGGNPGLPANATNPQINLAALLQASATSTTPLTCNSSGLTSTFTNINELSTAAMGVAMGQFYTPSGGFGSPSSTQAEAALTTAAATALTLASTTNGTANATVTLAKSPFSVTATPEATKINTIADILSDCVNSTGGTYSSTSTTACSKLFGAIATSTATPTDTLYAAVLFGTNSNPTPANSTILFNLIPTTPPYPAVSTQPADWSIAIQYNDTSSSCSAGTTSAAPTCVLNDPQAVAFDASGNVWVMNHNSITASSVAQLTSLGSPLQSVNSVGTTYMTVNSDRNMAIDPSGSAWIGTSTSANVFKIAPVGGTSLVLSGSIAQPYAPVIDGAGRVFFGHNSSSETASVDAFIGTNTSPATQTSIPSAVPTPAASDQLEFPDICTSPASNTGYTKCTTQGILLEYGAIDTNGNFWFDTGSTANQVLTMTAPTWSCTVFPCLGTTSGDTVTANYTVVASAANGFPTLATPLGVAAGASGSVWFANSLGGSTPANTVAYVTSTTAGSNFGSATSVAIPYFPAADGAGNIWVANHGSSSVSEFQGVGTSIGTVLSPTNTGTAPFTTVGFSHPGIAGAYGIAIDPAGNVWVANNTVTTGGLTEIVGIAAPTIAPLSASVKAGVASKP